MEEMNRKKYLDEFGDYIFKINRFANRMSMHQDMSRQQYMLLRTVFEKKKCTVTELADHIGLSSSATTISINRLVKNGLLVRSRDEQDRRVVWIELSETAVPLVEEIIESRNQLLAQLLSPLNEEELKTFLELNRKIICHLG